MLSSKARFLAETPEISRYFGRMPGFPPGLPGGGITGVLPLSGVGARISGSTPAGGHSTPLDFASLSPSGSPACPVVLPSGAAEPRGDTGFIGVQSLVRGGAGEAVCAGGVAAAGGACALAMPGAAASSRQSSGALCFITPRKRSARAEVPPRILKICGNGSAKNAPSAASGDARKG